MFYFYLNFMIESVRIAQQVQVDEIPLPDTPEMPMFCKYLIHFILCNLYCSYIKYNS